MKHRSHESHEDKVYRQFAASFTGDHQSAQVSLIQTPTDFMESVSHVSLFGADSWTPTLARIALEKKLAAVRLCPAAASPGRPMMTVGSLSENRVPPTFNC